MPARGDTGSPATAATTAAATAATAAATAAAATATPSSPSSSPSPATHAVADHQSATDARRRGQLVGEYSVHFGHAWRRRFRRKLLRGARVRASERR